MARWQKNTIHPLKVGDEDWREDPKLLRQHAVDFFTNLLQTDSLTAPYYAVRVNFLKFSDNELRCLSSIVTEEEVHTVVMDMHPLKASGIDGLPAMFFQKKLAGSEEKCSGTVQGVMEGGNLEEWIKKTILVPIPKDIGS
ncbi:hypothetical protein J1N35_009789 [Gossypium stocksii]|uniref:Uncharacterized protein n=1 Tax=Gossypium stocksii TaxID=47602 RepID=A0A9D4AC49_9ROSI|nr:hypothetical protein J1N35_009789 [Gossypium stocksii]